MSDETAYVESLRIRQRLNQVMSGLRNHILPRQTCHKDVTEDTKNQTRDFSPMLQLYIVFFHSACVQCEL